MWSVCDIFVCSVCTGNWCIFIMFVMCANTDISFLYVFPMNCHIVVSVCCTLHVKKSQGMEQLVYNYSVPYASVALEVQLLGLWVIENLWLTVSRQERHFVTTRSLIVAGISAEATASSQTWWSQQNMSIVPFICENQLCQNVQGEGQRPEWERNFGKIIVFGSYRRVEGDYWQEGNGGQRKQEGFASNIMHRTDFYRWAAKWRRRMYDMSLDRQVRK